MTIAKLKLAVSCFSLAAVALLFTACKPAEETKPQTPATVVTNAPASVEPATAANAPATTNAPILIGPTKAREHIGEQATVRGVVSDVHVTAKGDVFLNFGGKFPNTIFTAVCFKNAIPTDQLKALKGKTISVSGKIKDYNGQVEIVLDSADQISQ